MRTLPTTPRPTPTTNTTQPTPPTPNPPARPGTRPAGDAIMDDPVLAGVLHSAWSGDPLVVVPSPPGAGKTRLVALLAETLDRRAGLRIGIAAQTRDQAVELARRVSALDSHARLIWPREQPTPDLHDSPGAAVVRGNAVRFPSTGGGIIIATTARWLFCQPDRLACDVMIVDEAWQATYGDVCALGALAPQLVCVGDPGQIDPVVTGRTTRWQHSPTAPHLPAPEALMAAHGDAVSVVTLRHTWRLGPQTTALVQPTFYPRLTFTSRRPPEHLTGPDGTIWDECTALPVTATSGPTDPTLTRACAQRVREVLQATYTTEAGTRPVRAGDVAVVTSHVTQAAAVRALLSDLPEVLVGTANALQGLERPAVVALHPLAGYRDSTGFGTDLGRACVMLSRHRAHLSVVLDTHTSTLLHQISEPTPAQLTHRALLHRLGV